MCLRLVGDGRGGGMINGEAHVVLSRAEWLVSVPADRAGGCVRPATRQLPSTRRSAGPAVPARVTRLESRTLQQPQVERREHQDDPDVHHQSLPEPVPEEQDVHADHDGHHHEHVERDSSPASHPSLLLRTVRLVNLTDPARRTASFPRLPLLRVLPLRLAHRLPPQGTPDNSA
jgi:hypothetical protein